MATKKTTKKTAAKKSVATKGFVQAVVTTRSELRYDKCRSCGANLQQGEEVMVINTYNYSYGYGGYGKTLAGKTSYHRHCVEAWLAEHPPKIGATKPVRVLRAEELEAEFNSLRDQLTEQYAELLLEPEPKPRRRSPAKALPKKAPAVKKSPKYRKKVT